MCPNIWDLTKTESFRKEFIINPKYWGTVKIRINRPKYRLSENSIPFVLVTGLNKIMIRDIFDFEIREWRDSGIH